MRVASAAALVAAVLSWGFIPASPALGAEATRPAQPWRDGALDFPDRVIEVAPVFAGQPAVSEVTVRNPTPRDIRIVDVVVRAPQGFVEGIPVVVPAGGTARFRVGLHTSGLLGTSGTRFGVYTDEHPTTDRGAGSATYRMGLNTFVRSAYDPPQFIADFGEVVQAQGKSVDLRFSSRDVPRLALESGDDPTGLVQVQARAAGDDDDPQRIVVRATMPPGAAPGPLAGILKLRTNVPDQPVIDVPYRATVYGDIRPRAAPVDYGRVLVGEPRFHFVEVESRSGRRFDVVGVRDPGAQIREHEVVDCPRKSPSCRNVKLVFDPNGVGGVVRGQVVITAVADGERVEVPVEYSAIVTRREAEPLLWERRP